MQVLLIKMSSMGDIIHTLPALTDAMRAIPDLKIDWVVEPAFSDIPAWHPAVNTLIPIALRQWRKNIFSSIQSGDIPQFYKTLRQKKYDAIIDAQGLLKSAAVAKLAHGETYGFDKNSIREKIAAYFYDHTHSIDKNQHAITRTRKLFAETLKYDFQDTRPDFNIDTNKLPPLNLTLPEKYGVFIHGTTWATKHYPEISWEKLLAKADAAKLPIYLPWGNIAEKNRAEKMAKSFSHALVLPSLVIGQMATVFKNAAAVVTVDTGLGHLSAALTTPTIALYGPTDPKKVNIVGDHAIALSATFPCAPCGKKICAYAKTHKTDITPACYTTIDPDRVWDKVQNTLERSISQN